MECLTSSTTPRTINISGNKGIIIVKGTSNSVNNPVNIPKGMIKTIDKINNIKKNAILIGMLKIYNPAENSLIKITMPKPIKRIENISILLFPIM
ncbi:MAG: hypothetical protein KAS18_06235 [Calditrichia bacterium]|nr:hypothetical protein [Calditrichia bacterium]